MRKHVDDPGSREPVTLRVDQDGAVDRLGELVPAMTEAFGAKYKNRLVFLDVHIDPDEHVYPMAIKGGSMRDMFLSKTETN